MRSILIGLLAFGAAFAAGPVLSELQPRGAELGRPFTLTVVGRGLAEGAAIWSTMPASFTPVVPSSASPGMMNAPGRTASFLVEPAAGLAPGIYPIRVQSPNGISNVLLFTIGTFPEQTERESAPYMQPNRNDSIENAEPIESTPMTLNGTLRGAERDLFRVHGKAGERRVFEVEARRAGSAIDPVLRILDGSGKQLARSEDTPGTGLDARLDFTFPREGYYYVELRDARFSRQVQNYYRLKIGSYTYADGIFPLGGQRGGSVEVSFHGGNLPNPVKHSINLSDVAAKNGMSTVLLPGSAALPFPFAVSDLPELIEPTGPVPVPAVINGRLKEPGEVDRYRIAVTPGDKLLLEVQARELGTSRIEAIITAYGAEGKKIDSAGDKPLADDVFAVQGTSRTSSDPFLNVTVPDGVQELTIAVEDLAQRGGPHYPYRVVIRRQPEEFLLSLLSPHVNIPAGGTAAISVLADRRGYDGPIRIAVAELPAGIRLSGGFIPREHVDPKNTRTFNRRGMVILSADAGAKPGVHELVVYGEAKLEDGTALRRRAAGPAMTVEVAGATAQGVVDRQRPVTASWLGFDLPAAVAPPPPATLEVKQVKVTNMAEGNRYDFEYRWEVNGRGAELPQTLNVEIVGARDTRVTNMQKADSGGSFSVNTTKSTAPDSYDVIVRGKVKAGGAEEEIYAQPVRLLVAEGSTTADASRVP
jgi:hypothetical protein